MSSSNHWFSEAIWWVGSQVSDKFNIISATTSPQQQRQGQRKEEEEEEKEEEEEDEEEDEEGKEETEPNKWNRNRTRIESAVVHLFLQSIVKPPVVVKLQSCRRSTEWPTVFSWTSVENGLPTIFTANTSNPNPTLIEFGIPEIQKVCREAETNSLAFSLKWNHLPSNIASVNSPCQRETIIPIFHFQVRTVSFRQAILGW